MVLRITTWNVNGIRNPFGYQPWRDRRTFEGMFDILEADIVIMQELKIQRKDLRDDMVLVPGWDCYFSLPKHKKGYSGVGIYTRQAVCAPIRAEEGVLGVLPRPGSTTSYCNLPEDEHIGGYLSHEQLLDVDVDAQMLDAEGRCVVLEFPAFVLFGIYSPANSSGLRDDFRFGFLNALDKRIRNLVAMGKRVVVTGDLNVSREPLDTANADETMRKDGITLDQYLSTQNRRVFNQLLEGGTVIGARDEGREKPVLWDICRGFHPTRKGMFTHWEQKINARPGNFGSRIDFVLCSLDMKSWFCESDIQEGLMGSDHCPVYAVLKDEVNMTAEDTIHLKDIMNPPNYFERGERRKDYSMRDIPIFSGKLLQEFDKRRSIKDMFGRKPSLKTIDSIPEVIQTPPISDHTRTYSAPIVTTVADRVSLDSMVAPVADLDFLSQSSQVTASPNLKRTAPSPAASPRTLKRAKSNTTTSATANAGTKGSQSSLKGFFRPKPSSQMEIKSNPLTTNHYPVASQESVTMSPSPQKSLAQLDSDISSRVPAIAAGQILASEDPDAAAAAKGKESQSPEAFVDPIVSKECWSKMFAKPVAPRCEHNEPCKTMQTKKKGFNCGREFWMCVRPLGPTGSKEKNTQWRCSTFIWSSDWNGSGERNP